MNLPVLLTQFPVSLSISSNLKNILRLLAQAERGDLVLFPEGALSGYDPDLSFLQTLDLDELAEALEQLRTQASRQGIHQRHMITPVIGHHGELHPDLCPCFEMPYPIRILIYIFRIIHSFVGPLNNETHFQRF